MKRWVGLFLLVATGCSRCGPPGPVDAAVARVHRSIDLRTAVLSCYPENRGARVLDGSAALVRTLDRPIRLEGEVAEVVRRNGFELAVDGGVLLATRPPYTLRIDGSAMQVSLPVGDGDVAKLLGVPNPMSSEQLGLWFPRPEGASVVAESFVLSLRYQSSVWRAGYLAWQMAHLNTRGTWRVAKWPEGYELERRPDGGGGGTPDVYSLTMTDNTTDARIEVHREGAFVDLKYVLATEGPP